MMKDLFKKITWLVVILLLFVMAINFRIESAYNEYIFKKSDQLPDIQTALVLGASVKPNKEMSDVFKDRVEVSIDLYRNGKVKKILVSGDSKDVYYDEVGAAQKYLLKEGIPQDDIILDKSGFDTYMSIKRAKEVFGLDSFIIVTQNFHLPRAIYIARKLGIDAYGISADLHRYDIEERMFYREKLANVKAFFDVGGK
ncbi:MAG: ElyC/SanA/YdcF family protein [Candidatus Pacebacteria bacterium]|nr:ElyC/SanA/YdcF family protein [Candidatus Paceibacterota bacterium]